LLYINNLIFKTAVNLFLALIPGLIVESGVRSANSIAHISSEGHLLPLYQEPIRYACSMVEVTFLSDRHKEDFVRKGKRLSDWNEIANYFEAEISEGMNCVLRAHICSFIDGRR